MSSKIDPYEGQSLQGRTTGATYLQRTVHYIQEDVRALGGSRKKDAHALAPDAIIVRTDGNFTRRTVDVGIRKNRKLHPLL